MHFHTRAHTPNHHRDNKGQADRNGYRQKHCGSSSFHIIFSHGPTICMATPIYPLWGDKEGGGINFRNPCWLPDSWNLDQCTYSILYILYNMHTQDSTEQYNSFKRQRHALHWNVKCVIISNDLETGRGKGQYAIHETENARMFICFKFLESETCGNHTTYSSE